MDHPSYGGIQSAGYGEIEPAAQALSTAKVVRVTIITVLLVLSGASSMLSFYAMGQTMSAFPVFLLYFCNGVYGFGYFLILGACILIWPESAEEVNAAKAPLLAYDPSPFGPPPTSAANTRARSSPFWGNAWEQKYYVAIGFCTGLSLELQQFANGKVAGDLQTVLYQLYLPATAICSAAYLKTKLTGFNLCGGLGVIIGILLVCEIWVKSTGNQGAWPLVYGAATFPLGMACVLQEELFEAAPAVSAIKMSAWSTLWGVVFNILTAPISMTPNLVYDENGVPVYPDGATFSQLLTHQSDSWACFFDHDVAVHTHSGSASDSGELLGDVLGGEGLPTGCKPHAATAVMIYVVSYGVNVWACMALVKEMSAVFCVVFGAMVVPASTLCFSLAPLLTLYQIPMASQQKITWNIALGAAVCVASLFVFKGDLFLQWFKSR